MLTMGGWAQRMESSAAETKAAGNWTDVANALRWRRAGVDACNAMKDRGNKETTAEKKKGVASGRCDSLTHIEWSRLRTEHRERSETSTAESERL